jgi:hypothetical protein
MHKPGVPLVFEDHPLFRPNLTPYEIFKLGSFGGYYFRPIYSSVANKHYKNVHKEFPWAKSLDPSLLTQPEQIASINRYNVISGTSLEYWESKGWIKKQDPYGWVQWYCRFYAGRRSPDDTRQIKRWLAFAGPNGRFRRHLMNKIKTTKNLNNKSISPIVRQGLQHWAYILTKRDFLQYKTKMKSHLS